MKKKKIFKIVAIVGIAGVLIGGGIGLYMFNMPHRNVQSASADYSLKSSEIVAEYLSDKDAANQKYLAADGDSKILEVTGIIAKISEDFNGNKVLLLKEEGEAAGVSATFTAETNQNIQGLSQGQTITVKGVIRSGASYDEDLEMYEHVILEKSNVINK
ncbi:MAG: OB-fold protein [Cyclobacteriaceae bacterium]